MGGSGSGESVQYSVFSVQLPKPSLNTSAPPALARIEVGAAELPTLLADGTAARVAEELKKIGYTHVTLDLQGYRRGGADNGVSSRLTPHESRDEAAMKRDA